nr:hypothetical protein [Tanacetum cinerariifolium]
MRPVHGFPLSRRGREAALMQFHCVGMTPTGSYPTTCGDLKGYVFFYYMDGTSITEINIKHGNFLYPEEDVEPSASISDVVFKF